MGCEGSKLQKQGGSTAPAPASMARWQQGKSFRHASDTSTALCSSTNSSGGLTESPSAPSSPSHTPRPTVPPVAAPIPTGGTALFKQVPPTPGSLRLMHFPSKRQVKGLRQAGGSLMVTLQSDKEGAQAVEKMCREVGMRWMQIDFWALYKSGEKAVLASTVEAVVEELRQGGSVTIHCAAGIHRTGMFAYAVLRALAYTPEAAVKSLKCLREVTYQRVGAHQVSAAERFFSVVEGCFPHPHTEPLPTSILPPATYDLEGSDKKQKRK